MPTGYLSLILHAHLPFVRHPEYPEFLEEDWLYEAITEVYLPLLFILRNLARSDSAPRLAMTISPPLAEMLNDELLKSRFSRHLENLLDLSAKERERTRLSAPEFLPAAEMYFDNLSACATLWHDTYNQNLIEAFRQLQDQGVLEIITCGATHGFLPLVSSEQAKRAQILVAKSNYIKHFGRAPRGIWLPECAYQEGLESLLAEAGIQYFISDTHAILFGDPRPRFGVHSPIKCHNGVAVFARDVETSQQVWSAEVGYPGNPVYREFYRDIGWDAPLEYLKPYLHSDGKRRHLGLKYHRISGRDVPQQFKLPYEPDKARQQAAIDAGHFLYERIAQSNRLKQLFGGRSPLIVAPYDAELFGHWWFEGPQFLDFLFRKIHFDQKEIMPVTPGDFLDLGLPIQSLQPADSSWGENGYYKVWLNERNSWMYTYQHDAEREMTLAANRFFHMVVSCQKAELLLSCLNQMARELLLAQSSDWAFQIYQGTTVEYSTRRFMSHINRFNLLRGILDKIDSGTVQQEDLELLREIQNRDNIFAEIDFRIYSTS
jgi:1,4-alpha-glucan branching enzyme